MAPQSSDELVVFCICRTVGLMLIRTPTLNAGVASPPDVVHLHEKDKINQY